MQWQESEMGLTTQLTFENQTKLAEFVLNLAQISDRMQHHADMQIAYNRLHMSIFTHDEGRITQKDWALRSEIENLYKGV